MISEDFKFKKVFTDSHFNFILFLKVERLVNKLKTQTGMYGDDKSPERHSIHGNSPSPVRHRGNMDMVMPGN
jgi:hypothetical protein